MRSDSLVLALLLREEWRGGTGVLGANAPLPTGLSALEVGLVRSAAALGAGEPKRAVQILDAIPEQSADLAAVERALRILADSLEWNWFPGGAGAVLEPGDVDRLRWESLPPTTPQARPLVLVADRLLAVLGNWRSIAGGTRTGGGLATPEVVTDPARQLVHELAQLGVPAAVGPAALAVADLEFRAGRADRAGAPLADALQAYRAVDDQVGVAACLLAQGDWALEPSSHPELLGERLDGPLLEGGPARNLEVAAKRYQEAEQLYTAAGATRGAAAVALRLARLAEIGNDRARGTHQLDRCRDLALETGDGALAQLAVVHRALASVVVGEAVDVDAVGADIAAWANTVGSRSFARGLARLCHAKARRWRDRDVLRSRHALRIAEAVNDGIGAVTEPALVRAEVAAQYGAANYRRAAFVLTLLDLADAEQAPAVAHDEVAWIRLVELAVAANRDANALRDPDGIAAAREHLGRVVGLGVAGGSMMVALARMVAVQTSAHAGVMIPLYRGVAARAHGDLPDADRLFQEALDAAVALGPAAGMLPAVVLGTMRRTTQAVALLEPLVASGELAADLAASFFVRLGEYERALAVLDKLPPADQPAPNWKPWEWAALHAEALVGVGRHADGLPIAERAIGRFEYHLAKLSRDVFRTMATDDVVVAGLYTTAIRAHVGLVPQSEGPGHLAEAFRLSDRCRGAVLGDLIDLDRTAGSDRQTVAAVRGWLRAGAELARHVEGLGTDVQRAAALAPAQVKRSMRAAERLLDDAEVTLTAVAPSLLASRTRLPDTPAMDTIQERLEPGTLLLQFHAFDDALICWAITNSGAEMEHRSVPTPMLTAHTQRFVRALADPGSTAEERAAAAAPLRGLLEPFAETIDDHRRLVIVPHGPLAALPFHALPFGDSDLATTHVVSYLPAASVVPRSDAAARTFGRGATTLVLGDPAYAPGRLRGLPGAAVEAVAIAQLRGVDALVGGHAERLTVMDRLAGAQVVHLATHGLLHEGAPYSAELALAGDASLTVPDLMGLDTTIDLAVLSACDSGRGRATAAGDVIGLTRALMSAGARELVVSLWPVDDQLACLTMVRFHEQLLTPVPPAEALTAATRAVRAMSRAEADAEYAALRATAGGEAAGGVRSARDIRPDRPAPRRDDPGHPAFWAPFVHVGA